MPVEPVTLSDIASWLVLAQEVEPLLGPMVTDKSFPSAMRQIIAEKNGDPKPLCGIIAILPENNEITWLSVANQERGKGYGSELLTYEAGINPAGIPTIIMKRESSKNCNPSDR